MWTIELFQRATNERMQAAAVLTGPAQDGREALDARAEYATPEMAYNEVNVRG